jgi:hypothetical protein
MDRAAVTKLVDDRLVIFKEGLVVNINDTLTRMHDDIMSEMRKELLVIKNGLSETRTGLSEARAGLNEARAGLNEAKVGLSEVRDAAKRETGSRELMIAPETERQLVAKISTRLGNVLIPKITEKVMDTVRTDINDNILPVINSTMEHLAFATVDGQEMVNEYRKGVVAEDAPKLIGDAKLARNMFGHYQRMLDDEY